MPIQMLSSQLANQISAGEVVERPASVIKELVENSIDAGANQIWLDIEKGGSNLIRLRDNGCGIPKAELHLALARHATSKIANLDDLENILSLGFRGEALASICSVSRLTLTSKPENQAQAWSIFVEGRDQTPSINPASHPNGTTIEVIDLFFNTPARKKFLRSEKTEFAHIDEVVRRIALAKPNVAFKLTHNGKLIRQYKSATTSEQQLKRLSQICGLAFAHNAFELNWQYQSWHLHGWISLQDHGINYLYINGRMVKDKVMLHALRQAYAEFDINPESSPSLVLFLDILPNEVDVNIHPTKHEVRFHQPRLIHDFIYQAMLNVLKENATSGLLNSFQVSEPIPTWNVDNRSSAGANIFKSPPIYKASSLGQTKTHHQLYRELITPQASQERLPVTTTTKLSHDLKAPSNILQALSCVQNHLLLQQQEDLFLLNLVQLQKLHLELNLSKSQATTPLLIPLALTLDKENLQAWKNQQSWWQKLGFEGEINSHYRLVINAIPQILRGQNLQQMLLKTLNSNLTTLTELTTKIVENCHFALNLDFSQALRLLSEVENLQTEPKLQKLLISVDLKPYTNSHD